MIGMQGGQPLMYSTYKTRCPERDSCAFFKSNCEAAALEDNRINHLLFSSEEMEGDNIWQKLKPGELVGVDQDMIFSKLKINLDFV